MKVIASDGLPSDFVLRSSFALVEPQLLPRAFEQVNEIYHANNLIVCAVVSGGGAEGVDVCSVEWRFVLPVGAFDREG